MFLQHVTVPQAEYTGLCLAFSMAYELGATSVEALVDAELIARHLNGAYQVRSFKLRPYYDVAKAWMAVFESCVVREFPKAGPKNKRRFGNARADQLANEAMDSLANVGG